MATIIDSLLVKLGLDSSEFDAGKRKVDKGLKDTGSEADKTGAKFKKSGKDGADGFGNVAASAAKFLALIGGTMAVKRFIEQTVESSAALDRLSKNLQEGVSTVSAWSNSAELAGGSAEGLQGTLDMLSKSQTELQLTGQSQLIPYFSALGVSIADASGKARSGNDVLLDLADRFSKMDRTTANNMGRMMGIDQGTMNLLLKGRKEVELMVARQKEYGAVTKQQAEESSRLKLAMTESRQSFEAFGRELLSAAMPALEGLFSMMKDFGAWMRENKEFVNAFLTIIAVGLGAIAAATIPINLTVVAVLALAAAIAALWQDYQTWKRGGDSFIDWSKWEPGFTAAGKAIKWLKDLLGDMVYRAIAAADVLSAVFERDWKRAKFAAGEFMSGTGKKYGEEEPKPPTVAPAQAAQPNKQTAAPAPAGNAAPGTVNSKAKPGGGEQERQAMEFFQRQGWTKEQAAGLAANIKRESSFDPNAVGDNGKAYGIAQWHPDRQAEFKKRFGKDIQGSTLDEQMAFMHYELTEGNERKAGNKLRQTKSAEDAAAAVSTHYERPADKEGEAAKRGQLAVAMLKVAPTPAAGVPAPQPAPAERREAAGVPAPQPAPAERREAAGVPAPQPAPAERREAAGVPAPQPAPAERREAAGVPAPQPAPAERREAAGVPAPQPAPAERREAAGVPAPQPAPAERREAAGVPAPQPAPAERREAAGVPAPQPAPAERREAAGVPAPQPAPAERREAAGVPAPQPAPAERREAAGVPAPQPAPAAAPVIVAANEPPKTYAERREAAGVPAPQPAPAAAPKSGKLYSAQPGPVAALGGIPGASQAAQGAGAAQVAMANAPAPAQEVSKSVETHIGEVKVYTAATDAKGIAGDMGKSLDYLFTSQANYGLT